MARGWESKDVESQVAATEAEKPKPHAGPKTDQEIQLDHDRQGIQLSRTRILNDLQSATNPHHRKSLEAALAHLDKKLSELD